MKDLWNVDKLTIMRKIGISDDGETPTFSTDMASGYLGGLTERILNTGLSKEEKIELTKIWDNITFNKLPITIPHPVHGKRFDRGVLFEPWKFWCCDPIILGLCWLYLGWLITNKKKYLFLYWFLAITHIFELILSPGDISIFIKNVYGFKSHVTHSHMLRCTTGYRLTKHFWYKLHMKHMLNMFNETNLDVLALWKAYFGDLNDNQIKFIDSLSKSIYVKGSMNLKNIEMKKYISLFWPPSIKYKSSELLTPEYRGDDYSSERSLLNLNSLTEEDRKKWSLDLIFPIFIIKN